MIVVFLLLITMCAPIEARSSEPIQSTVQSSSTSPKKLAGSAKRQWLEVYVAPFSHLDLFWGGTREECLARGNRIIAKAVSLAKEYPSFRFFLEDNVFVSNYVETHKDSPELKELKELVNEGRIDIAPKWAAIFQALPAGEVHARNLIIGKRFARSVFGIEPLVAHLGDLPGYTPQFPQMLAEVAVPFMVMTRMGPADKSLFRWKAPDGSKVLTWNTLKGYAWGTYLTFETTDRHKKQKLEKDLEDVRATTDGPILMNWGSDLWAPSDKLVGTIKALNKAEPMRFIIATPSEFFKRVEKNATVTELAGEIPSSWPNIASSLLHLWELATPATNALLTAEKFATINYALGYADYPQEQFDFLWKKLIESMDHNHDGQGGSIGDDRKFGYSQMTILQSEEIMRDMMRNIAERVQFAVANGRPIVVFNPLGWKRGGVVKAHITLFGDVDPSDIAEFDRGMRLVDDKGKAVPFHIEQSSENISRALEIVFVARDLPSLGYRTYYLVPGGGQETFEKTTVIKLDSEKDRKDPRRTIGNDVVENQYFRVTVDKATGEVTVFDRALNRDVCRKMAIVGVEERGGNATGVDTSTGRTIFNSVREIHVEEHDTLRTVVKIAGQIADIPIVQRLILYSALNRVDIENTVVWRRPRFLRLQQLFPFEQDGTEIHYGIPFGANSSAHVMPQSGPDRRDEIRRESWIRSRLIHDWIHAGNSDWGFTIAANHQLMRLDGGLIRAEMLRGARFTSARVVRRDTITSIPLPPPGTYVFKYSLSSGRGDWKSADAYRAGIEFANPLVPVIVIDEISKKPLPPSYSFCSLQKDNLIISALKKSDLDPAILLRIYEIEGSTAETTLTFLGQHPDFKAVNFLEEELTPKEQGALIVNPYQIRTIKLNLSK